MMAEAGVENAVSGESCEQPEETSRYSIYVRKLAHPGTWLVKLLAAFFLRSTCKSSN